MLSFIGRVELFESIILGMLTHNMSIYNWLLSLLRDLERAVHRFIWSGETSKNKNVTVAWNNVCKPTAKGGLGICSLCMLNEASNLKIALDILNYLCIWAILIRRRVMRNNKFITHHVFSSVWSNKKKR